jgi:hypothetical protein
MFILQRVYISVEFYRCWNGWGNHAIQVKEKNKKIQD